MRNLRARVALSKSALIIVAALFLAGTGPFADPRAHADDLTPRSLTMSDAIAGAENVTYELRFTYASTAMVGSLRLQFCADGPLPGTPCTAPPGLDTSSAALTFQAGATGFAELAGSPSNEIIISRPPSAITGGTAAVYTFAGIENPSAAGPIYARVSTYASSDGSGSLTDFGGLALSINEPPTVSAEVPPYLLFCLGESIAGLDCNTATEPFSNVGVLGPLVTGAAQTQMIAGTNAEGGYSLWVVGGTMASGNNVLPEMAGEPSQTGESQFGINLRANSDPIIGEDPSGPGTATVTPAYNQPNQFRYQSGDTLATTNTPDNYRKYTVSYVINVDENQPGGVYATTLTYIALANF